MDKQTRWYIILGSILAAVLAAVRMLKFLGVAALPMWLSFLISAVFTAALVAILWILGGDQRVKHGWRVFARFMGGFVCVSFLAGLIVTLLGI